MFQFAVLLLWFSFSATKHCKLGCRVLSGSIYYCTANNSGCVGVCKSQWLLHISHISVKWWISRHNFWYLLSVSHKFNIKWSCSHNSRQRHWKTVENDIQRCISQYGKHKTACSHTVYILKLIQGCCSIPVSTSISACLHYLSNYAVAALSILDLSTTDDPSPCI